MPDATALDIGVVLRKYLREPGERVVAVDDQHRQVLVQRHHAQRMQIQARVGDLLRIILEGLACAAIDARKAADAQLLVAEKC